MAAADGERGRGRGRGGRGKGAAPALAIPDPDAPLIAMAGRRGLVIPLAPFTARLGGQQVLRQVLRAFEVVEKVHPGRPKGMGRAVRKAYLLDRKGGTLSEREALGELESLLMPLVPLLLEAATRELHEETRSPGIVASIAQGLESRLGPRLRAKGSRAIPTARRVVETVLLGLVRPALGLRPH